jgi:hypothetical protein
MAVGPPSRKEALAERVASARERVEAMPGAPLVREVVETERDLGGGLIAGGVAFRIFLWLGPLGLLPVRGLLEARSAAARAVRGCRRPARARLLEPLMQDGVGPRGLASSASKPDA